jgi:hypothetical protein
MLDPLGIIQCIDLAVRRCEELARARENFRKNPQTVKKLRSKYSRLRRLIQAEALKGDTLSEPWQEVLVEAEEYFKTAKAELDRVSQALRKGRVQMVTFFMANRIAESVAALSAGFEHLEVKLLIIEGFARMQADEESKEGTKWREMCDELGAKLRVRVVRAIGAEVPAADPRSHKEVDKATSEAARGVFLAEFVRLRSESSHTSGEEAYVAEVPAEGVDEEAMELLMDGLDKSVAAVTDNIRSQMALSEDVKLDFEQFIEHL